MTDRTSFFQGGGDRDSIDVGKARAVASRLAPLHGDLSYNLLFSACAYVLRDGRAPKDSAAVAEARSRLRMAEQAVARNAERFSE